MASVTAAVGVAAPVAFSSATAASTSSTSRAQLLAPGGLKASTVTKSVEWNKKTVSNGSRTDAFLVLNPYTQARYETLSYLPQLTDEQIVKQVDYLLRNGWIPAIEFDKSARLTREYSKMPGYYEGRYWTMWKLPLFGANDSTQVLDEVKNCKSEYPDAFIRIIGFDKVRQVQVVSFVVVKPKGY